MNKEKEIQKINSCINDLVYEKSQIKKAYNYYHCFRDREQFKAIEKNYGVGTPTSVEFTPLIKKHIDVLVGEYLELDPDLQISCKDDATISNILRDKQLAAHKECFDYFSKYLENSIVNILMGSQEPTNDPFIDKEIQKIKESVEKDYVSQYEIAAQNILNYAKNSRDIDMKNKMRELFTDLLVSGTAYYQVKPSPGRKGIQLRINNPVDSFIERNVNSFYLNKSPRCVVRRYLTVDQIMAEYGDDLTDEARSILKEYKGGTKEGNSYIVRTISSTDAGNATQLMQHPGILGGMEVVPTMANNDMEYPYVNRSLIEVYECEWIEVDKTNTMQRHEGVKIGGKIYICKGVNDNVPRSVSNPRECSLSLNGMFFNDKNGVPQSLILNTMSLQD